MALTPEQTMKGLTDLFAEDFKKAVDDQNFGRMAGCLIAITDAFNQYANRKAFPVLKISTR